MSRASRAKAQQTKQPVKAIPVIAKANASRKRRWGKFLVLIICIAAGTAVVGMGIWCLVVASTDQYRQTVEQDLLYMKQQVGIVNGEQYPMVIADSLSSTTTTEGFTVLFAGSLSSSQSDTLRMGYTAPNGDSYIIKVPVSQIKFHQQSSGVSSSIFQFTQWDKRNTLQDNIDSLQSFKSITVNLSPDEYKKLIQ